MRTGVIGLAILLLLSASCNQDYDKQKQESATQKAEKAAVAVPESKPILRSVEDDFDFVLENIKDAIADVRRSVHSSDRRCQRRAFNFVASRPPRSSASSSSRYSTASSPSCSVGHVNVPRSSLFASTHTPDSS